MRKIMAAVLCAVMCLTAFAGCSKAELGYLDLCKSMMETMDSCNVQGQTEIMLDFDVLKDYAAAVADEIGAVADTEGTEELTGSHTVLLDYSMQMDMDKMKYNMATDITYEGKKYALGTIYFDMTEGMSISAETLLGLYDLLGDITEGMDGSYFFKDDFEKALCESLGGKNISLYSMEELGITPEDLGNLAQDGGFGSMYDAVFQFYKDAFNGFESGETLVKEISGGYEIDVDGKAVARLVANMLDFFAQNPEQLLDATENYVVEVMKQAGDAVMEEELRTEFAELRSNTQEFSEALQEFSAMWKEAIQDSTAQMLLGSFHYSERVTQNGGSFVNEDSYGITYNGKSALNISSKAATENAAVAITFPKADMTLEELSATMGTLVQRFNPAVGATVTWGFEDPAAQATIEVKRQEAAPFEIGDGAVLEDIIVRDGRAYLPLRGICDVLGENVTWNKTERKAYIAKDGKNIAMNGILENGKSFVGLREFEKLGYTVDFRSVDGLKEAEITR